MTHPGLPRRESVHPVQRRAASAPHLLDVQSQAVPSRSEPARPRPARLWRRRWASADRRQPGRTARLCPAPWPFRSRPGVQRRPRPLHMKSSRRPASSWRSAGSPSHAAGHPRPCPTTTEARRAGQVTCLRRGPRRAPSSHRTRPGARRGRLPQQDLRVPRVPRSRHRGRRRSRRRHRA
jgi:hypothetical protein